MSESNQDLDPFETCVLKSSVYQSMEEEKNISSLKNTEDKSTDELNSVHQNMEEKKNILSLKNTEDKSTDESNSVHQGIKQKNNFPSLKNTKDKRVTLSKVFSSA